MYFMFQDRHHILCDMDSKLKLGIKRIMSNKEFYEKL